jgi:V/A-type H+-transporting ATPase subunit I
MPPKAFDAMKASKEGAALKMIPVSRDKGAVRFVVVDGAEAVAGALSGAEFALPEMPLAQLREAQDERREQIAHLELQFAGLDGKKGLLADELKALLPEIEFEVAHAGMDRVSDDVIVDAKKAEPFAVSLITGYVPDGDVGVVKRAASENGWALYADDPAPDDEVPTLLRNNRLTKLIYPLTGFLEVVPGYKEVDISGWFLFFFCIFFGMIFGDAGYGLILLLIAIIGIVKTSKKGVPQILKLLLLLSISNVAWGVLTCAWFGVAADKLPAFFASISLPLISNAQAVKSAADKALVDQNLMIFCFSLALLQLGVAHIKGIIRNIRSLRAFAELGNIGMLAGMYDLILSLVVSNQYRQIPFLPAALYLIIGGFALSFVFANYDGSIGRSILESVKNIIPTVLGVTNVFSDVMSYIRLWAVGLAGSSISTVVNTLAGPLLGSFLVFLAVILLVFGHGLNLILNVLSVLVHGVRLNTLEFSGHLGLTWSGFAYKPLSKKAGR